MKKLSLFLVFFFAITTFAQSVSANPSEVCPGSSVTATSNGGVFDWAVTNHQWTLNGVRITGNSETLTIPSTSLNIGENTISVKFIYGWGIGQATSTTTIILKGITGPSQVCQNNTISLTGHGTPASGTFWTSSQPSIATVSNSGIVTGIAPGTTTITYRTSNSCNVTKQITVLPAPITPTINVTAATCTAAGSARISNYTATNGYTYTFSPTGPSVGTGGVINGMTVGQSYTVTASNGTCTSLASNAFSISSQLTAPATPIINVIAATCSAAGTATISNYTATNGYNYTFSPAGPSVGAGGVINGMTVGQSYTVTASNANNCTSASSASFVIAAQLPVLPVSVSITPNTSTTICAGTSVTFTATPMNGGTAPSYQWKVDGMNVGTNSATYTTTLTNNAQISVVMTSNETACNSGSPATSNIVMMTVGATSVYNGSGWSLGKPDDNGLSAEIATSYTTTNAAGSFSACNCTVNSGATLTISPNTYVEVLNEVTNNGRLIVESDGNLKQINNVTNTTPVTVRRLHTLTDARKEYNFLSSPVAGQNMKMIYGNNAANVPFVTVLRESTNSFVNATSTDYAVVAKGFSVKEPRLTYEDLSGDSLPVNEAQYKGVPNNGDITLAFPTYTAGRGYNLAGNPYPSNMDIIELYANSTTALIDPTFRLWDNSVNDIYVQMGGAYQGYSYALFNAVNDTDGFGIAAPGNGSGGPIGDKVPYRVIKVSQAFMVRATGAGAQLNYNNSMRKTSNTNTVFFGKSAERNRFRLQLVRSDGFTVQNGISYFAGGNAAFGREDSRIPNSSASDALFSFAGDAKVVINGRNIFATGDVVQLGLRHFTAGTYKIQAVDREGVFAKGQSVYLKDKQLGIVTDLTEGDYIFSSEAGEFTNRFEIVYVKEQKLATAQTNKTGIEVYRDHSDFVVRSQTENLEYAELYDAAGRLLYTVNGKSKEIRFNAETLLNGIYLLKAKVKGGAYFTKKIRK